MKIENRDHPEIEGLKTRGLTAKFQEILKRCMEEEKTRPGFDLIGMSYLNGALTGYFVNPADLAYLHIWEVKISPDSRIIYSETWREIMLVPIDGYRFRRDVILFKETEELEKLGFYICSPLNETLELDDLQWRCLWAIKENLKKHKETVSLLIDPDHCDKSIGPEVFNAYMQAFWDLQDILGSY